MNDQIKADPKALKNVKFSFIYTDYRYSPMDSKIEPRELSRYLTCGHAIIFWVVCTYVGTYKTIEGSFKVHNRFPLYYIIKALLFLLCCCLVSPFILCVVSLSFSER